MTAQVAETLRAAAEAMQEAAREIAQPGVRRVQVVEVPRVLLTVPEAASVAAVGETTAKKLVLTGEWPSVLIGRARRVVYADLLAWVEREKRGGQG